VGPARIIAVHADEVIEQARQLLWPSPRYEEWGTSMGNALRSILIRLVAYVAVAIAAGLLFLAGATVYELMRRGPWSPSRK
jgi:hypothetical protein